MPHSRSCPDGLNLDKLDRGHCLAECDMTSGQKLPSQGEREVQRPTRARRQNALHVQSQGRSIACQPHICACEPPRIGGRPGVSNPYTKFAVTVLSTHSPAGSGGHRNTTHHCFTSVSGRATTRSNIGLFPAECSRLPGSEQLTADERDRLVERGAARTGVTHRGVLVPDRHAAEEDEPLRG